MKECAGFIVLFLFFIVVLNWVWNTVEFHWYWYQFLHVWYLDMPRRYNLWTIWPEPRYLFTPASCFLLLTACQFTYAAVERFIIKFINEIRPRKSSQSNRFMCLKAYQTPKHSTMSCNNLLSQWSQGKQRIPCSCEIIYVIGCLALMLCYDAASPDWPHSNKYGGCVFI